MPAPTGMTGMDGLHACPKRGCPRRLPRHILACRPHWWSIPYPLRRELMSAWRTGDTPAYLAARERAVATLNGD